MAEPNQHEPLESQITPTSFDEFVGQERVVGRLQIAVEAAKHRGEVPSHVLLVGDAGFGKGTLARIINRKIEGKVSMLNGSTTGNLNDFVGLLTNLEDRDVLFIEDIHALDKEVAEFLCGPMNDFKLDIVIDSGANARAVRLNLPRFTLIGTATRTQRIPPAFLSSFQIVEQLDPYTFEELAALVRRFASIMRLQIDEAVPEHVAKAGCISPRDVLYRLQHVRDYGRIKARSQRVTAELAIEALKMLSPAKRQSEIVGHSQSHDIEIEPLKRRYQVFVSSTYNDLKDERRHLIQALLETKCIPMGMEMFPAANEKQWDLIKRVIDDCDYYIVVLGGMYGSIGPNGKSYTEMEFDYAVATGKSVFGFFHSDLDSLPGSKLEKNDDRRQKLALFYEKIRKRMCKPWNTPDGLESAIKSAILHAIENDRKPGWVRASDLPSSTVIANLKASVQQQRRRNQTSNDGVNVSIDVPITVFYREDDSPESVRSTPPRRHKTKLQLTADELFVLLGPRLAVKRPGRTLKMYLEEKLSNRVRETLPQTPGRSIARFSWSLEAKVFERVLDNFFAEKLVRIVRPPTGVSTKVPYWEITAKGHQRLAELRVAGDRAL